MSCDKVYHCSAKVAKAAIRRHRGLQHKLKCYRCKKCGGYHVTSKVSMNQTIHFRGRYNESI